MLGASAWGDALNNLRRDVSHPSRLAVAALRIIVLTTTMKWFTLVLSFPLSVLGGQSQFPVHHADAAQEEFDYKKSSRPSEFSLKEGRGVFSPDRKSTRLNSSHSGESRMPSSA